MTHPLPVFLNLLISNKVFLKLSSSPHYCGHTLDLFITDSHNHITLPTSIYSWVWMVHSKLFCPDLYLQFIGPKLFLLFILHLLSLFLFLPSWVHNPLLHPVPCKHPRLTFSCLSSFSLLGKALILVVLFLRILSCSYSLFLLKHDFSIPTEYSHHFTNISYLKPEKLNVFIVPCLYLQLLSHFSISFTIHPKNELFIFLFRISSLLIHSQPISSS